MNKAFEKILERLEDVERILLNEAGDIGCTLGIINASEYAKQIVQEVAEEYNDGWIPCNERLPEESLNSVIGWDAYRERCVFVQYLQGQWKLGNWEAVNITHWMNMPYHPKGE